MYVKYVFNIHLGRDPTNGLINREIIVNEVA